MNFTLTTKQQKEVEENLRLIHYLVQRFKYPYEDYDDMISIGTLGLMKAVATYDKSKATKFSTYAARVIQNEWLMGLRKNKHRIQELSLDEELKSDGLKADSDSITIGDCISDSDTSNIEERIANAELITNILNYVLNNFDTRSKIIFFYSRADITQATIANKLKISRSYVSRIVTDINHFISENHDISDDKKGIFKLELKSNAFQLSFSTSDVQRFNQILANVLIDPINHDKLQHFKVDCTKDQVEICLPAETDSFALIASLIREIELFKLVVN